MAKSGVYEILNTTNGKRYVGSATKLLKRKRRHWADLRGNCHHSRHLQRAWNKYGEDAFIFEVIEHWEPEFLVSFEQWWINMLQPEYNMCPVAGSCLGVTHTEEAKAKRSAAMMGHKHTRASRTKMSVAVKGRKFTDEHKANLSAAHTGQPNNWLGCKHAEESKRKMSKSKTGKPWSPARRAAHEAKKATHARGPE